MKTSQNVTVDTEIKASLGTPDFIIKEKTSLGDLVEINFWNEIRKEKEDYRFKKERLIKEKIEDLKLNKKPIGEVILDFKDYSSLFMFVGTLGLLGVISSNIYIAYIILPILGYFIGRDFLPKKIKIIDKKTIQDLNKTLEEFPTEDFENELASIKLLNSFKNNYGEDQLEKVFITSIKEQKEKITNNMIEDFSPEYKVSIAQLIKAAKNIEVKEEEKENVKKIVKSL